MIKTSHIRAVALFFFCMLSSALLPIQALALEDPAIQAAAAMLYDPASGTVLYEKNAAERRFPASTTKIMTALVVLENVQDLEQKVTVTEEDFADVEFDSSKAGFLVGEEIPVIDLLYGLLLPSGNEAANTLARFVGGSVESFAGMMNKRAAELGCKNTNFVNPNGLHDENHYTTAHDLTLIAAKAMENETFAEISNTAQKTLSETNKTPERGKVLKVFTTNMLIFSRNDPNFYAAAKGIKTGHTTPAGYCLVSTAEKKDSRLISVLLGCEKPKDTRTALTFPETKRLFEWGFENFESRTLVEKGDTVQQIPIDLSTDTDVVIPQVGQSLTAVVPKDIDMDKLVTTRHVPDKLRAPIKSGDVLGTMDISYNGVQYGTVELIAMNDVSLSKVLYYSDKLNNFFQSNTFKKIVIALAAALVLYITILVITNRRRKQRRRNAQRNRYRRY